MITSEAERRLRRARRAPLFPPSGETALDREAIERIVPHRGPSLLVEHITAVDPGLGRLVATRHLCEDDRAFEGHFPGDPVYPGALQVELMGQAGLCLAWFAAADRTDVPPGARPSRVRLIRVAEASFLREARPGDTLEVRVELLHDDGLTTRCIAQALRGGDPVSLCVFDAITLEEP